MIISLSSVICYCVPASALNEVLINEVELNPKGPDIGEEGIELYNPSNSSVDISGLTISSNGDSAADTLVISEGTILSPEAYHTVGRESQEWLDNTDEVIELRNESGILIDSAGPFCDGNNDPRTWQLSPDGQNNWVFSNNSLGGPNSVSLISELELPSQLASGHPILAQSEQSLQGNSTTAEAVTPAIQPNQNLTIAFINVRHGDSILIILPNTKTLLIDGGEREESGKVLATLREYGLSHIDMVLATHAHEDHLGGLFNVIENVTVGQVLGSQLHTTQFFQSFLELIETKQIPLKLVREGDSINLDPRVKIDVLNPPKSVPDTQPGRGSNHNSVALKLTYGEFSALFAADMEIAAEERLVCESPTALDADVLKAGHGGGNTSSTLPFLNAVTPEVVIISSGAEFRDGYPHYETLERIPAAGVQYLFGTYLDGTITLTANGCSNYYSIVTENNEKTTVVNDVSESEMATC